MNYKVSHPTKVVNCEINLPSSKSISNRLLIIKSLCKDNFEIENLSNSDDTKNLLKALNLSKKTIDVKVRDTRRRVPDGWEGEGGAISSHPRGLIRWLSIK